MAQTDSRKARQRRRLQKRRQEGRRRVRAAGAAGARPGSGPALAGIAFPPPPASPWDGPDIPGLEGPIDPAPSGDPLAPLIPTSADDDTRLG